MIGPAGLILMVLQGMGKSPQEIAKIPLDIGAKIANARIKDIMNAAVPQIAAKAQAEGWIIGQTKATKANPTPHKLETHEVTRDLEFRAWREVFAFHGGGHFADAFRDSQEFKVGAKVDPLITPQTPYEEMVRMVVNETEALTFPG